MHLIRQISSPYCLHLQSIELTSLSKHHAKTAITSTRVSDLTCYYYLLAAAAAREEAGAATRSIIL